MDAGRKGKRELLILAMDHRESLQKQVYQISGDPTAVEAARIAADKEAIFEGLLRSVDAGVERSSVGVLVDERYGAQVARRARAASISLAMPVERSGQKLFTLEYGTLDDGEWLRHLEAFSPDQVKVLVRFNPDDDAGERSTQLAALAAVSAASEAAGRSFLMELLVPASGKQLASVDGDALRYDRDVRPELTVRVIEEMQASGVEPKIWKVEGLETVEAAEQVVAAARAGDRSTIDCIVLGRDAPRDRLDHWLAVAAGVEGFIGFAIGRSIWEQPLVDHLASKSSRDELVVRVAEAFSHFANLWNTHARS